MWPNVRGGRERCRLTAGGQASGQAGDQEGFGATSAADVCPRGLTDQSSAAAAYTAASSRRVAWSCPSNPMGERRSGSESAGAVHHAVAASG